METTNNETLITVKESSSIVHPNKLLFLILYRYGLGFIFLIGFSGNFASLVTFMSPVLRVTSTGLLFFVVALSDMFYLMLSIFEFVEAGIVQEGIFLNVYDSVCRFRWFSKGLIRFCAAWILTLIAIDRWLRTCFPYKANQWCTRRNASIAILITAMLGFALHGHMLSIQLFGGFLPGIPSVACGPIDFTSFYLPFFFTQWPFIQVTFISLVPGFIIIITSISIYQIIRKEKKRIQPTNVNNSDNRRQTRLQRQMLLMMLASAVLFLLTTLPISLSQIVNAYRIGSGANVDLDEVVNEEAIVTLLLDLNYAINFYIHCLASKLFRKEFLRSFKLLNRLNQMATTNGNMLEMTRNNTANQLKSIAHGETNINPSHH